MGRPLVSEECTMGVSTLADIKGRGSKSVRLLCTAASENTLSEENLKKSAPAYPSRAQATRVGLQDITNLERAPVNGKRMKRSTSTSTERTALQAPCSQASLADPAHPLGLATLMGASPSGNSDAEALEPPNHKRMRTATNNIWMGDSDDIQCVGEYAPDIFASLLRNESRSLPKEHYFDLQKEISSKMRGILVDWLVEVHSKFRMRPETLYLTVSTMDRYLTRIPVVRGRLQLVGVAALCIAAKYEEIDPPIVDDYVWITDDAYTKEEIIVMECQMLTVLEFQVAVPTASHFLEPLLLINDCEDDHKEFVSYLTELSLLDHQMCRFPPSRVVCAAILLSNTMAGRVQPWRPILQEHTKHTEDQLVPCVQQLRRLLENAPQQQLQTICTKYKYHGKALHGVVNALPRTHWEPNR